MKMKFNITKSIAAGSLLCAASLGAAAAAPATISPADTSAPAHVFVGGITLTDREAVPQAATVVELSQVAAYGHLIDSVGTDEAAQEVDPIETSAIVAGVFHSVAIPIHSFPVSGRWAHVMQDISQCATAGS